MNEEKKISLQDFQDYIESIWFDRIDEPKGKVSVGFWAETEEEARLKALNFLAMLDKGIQKELAKYSKLEENKDLNLAENV